MNRRKGVIAVLAAACGALFPQRAKPQDTNTGNAGDLYLHGGTTGYVQGPPPILQFNLDDYKASSPVIRLTLGSRVIELTRDDIMDALEPPAPAKQQ